MLGIVTALTTGVVACRLRSADVRGVAANPRQPAVERRRVADSDTVERELATLQKLLGTREVLGSAASRLPGETIASLKTTSPPRWTRAGPHLRRRADRDPERAAQLANVVAAAFHQRQVAIERQQYQTAITPLTDEIAPFAQRRDRRRGVQYEPCRPGLPSSRSTRRAPAPGYRSRRPPSRRASRAHPSRCATASSRSSRRSCLRSWLRSRATS